MLNPFRAGLKCRVKPSQAKPSHVYRKGLRFLSKNTLTCGQEEVEIKPPDQQPLCRYFKLSLSEDVQDYNQLLVHHQLPDQHVKICVTFDCFSFVVWVRITLLQKAHKKGSINTCPFKHISCKLKTLALTCFTAIQEVSLVYSCSKGTQYSLQFNYRTHWQGPTSLVFSSWVIIRVMPSSHWVLNHFLSVVLWLQTFEDVFRHRWPFW